MNKGNWNGEGVKRETNINRDVELRLHMWVTFTSDIWLKKTRNIYTKVKPPIRVSLRYVD